MSIVSLTAQIWPHFWRRVQGRVTYKAKCSGLWFFARNLTSKLSRCTCYGTTHASKSSLLIFTISLNRPSVWNTIDIRQTVLQRTSEARRPFFPFSGRYRWEYNFDRISSVIGDLGVQVCGCSFWKPRKRRDIVSCRVGDGISNSIFMSYGGI